ncbi:VOC family protein [Prochlorococcus marinus]|uniref:Glyoxalase-like domain-containing protein n=1 Tax=Prochlorococcus marinus (strain MIT 9211) TaxID=93059 RepID=A9BA57_PROM4|nr:VOC family protein [Prochlorococcus marinus]ABX08719.1 Hypothetical protein P9211_07881 [Prochlorococcus marinus str. MIT 9211]
MNKIEPNFIISSDQPEKLAEFYGLVFGGKVSKGINNNHYSITFKRGLKIHIYRPSNSQTFVHRSTQSVAICFQEEPSDNPSLVIKEWYKRILPLGGSRLEGPREEEFGSEMWMTDPEGNNFLVFVPNNLCNHS